MEHQQISPALSSSQISPELDLKRYAALLWQWLWLVLLCSIVAGISSYVYSSNLVPVYQASSTLLVNPTGNPGDNYIDVWGTEIIARTYAELMQDPLRLEKVATQIGVTPEVVINSISKINVSPVRDTQLLQVQIEGDSPQLVAYVAKILPEVFIEDITSQQSGQVKESQQRIKQQMDELLSQIERTELAINGMSGTLTAFEETQLSQLYSEQAQYRRSYADLLRSYEDMNMALLYSDDKITIARQPAIPLAPIRPRVATNTLLAIIVGGMLALGLIFLIEFLDDRIKTPQDLTQLINTPLLGTISQMPSQRKQRDQKENERFALLAATEPRHPITEAYRNIRTNLRFSSVDTALNAFLVTSPNPGEGKTITTANLAIVIAQSGRSVILVDADLRRPQVHAQFMLTQNPGLSDALLADDLSPLSFLQESGTPNLRLLTSGQEPPNPSELLGSQRMRNLIAKLREAADVVIFDTPPVLAVTDAQVLAEQLQGALMVMNAQSTTRSDIIRAVEQLHHNEVRILGAVLNQVKNQRQGYSYENKYGVYYGKKENKGTRSFFGSGFAKA